MSLLAELVRRFRTALSGLVADPEPYLEMVRRSQDPRFGDYQANFAMPLSKQLDRPAREIAAQVIERLDVADLCQTPEIAGPGFVNLRLREDLLAQQLGAAVADERLGVPAVEQPRTYVVDYSSPNVAKPMHVGHIRSTVIGDSIDRTLRFAGHRVISDNHLGDWGTQFGMILYGYRHFVDTAAYQANPVQELARLYRLVRQVSDYHEARATLASGELDQAVAQLDAEIAAKQAAAEAAKKAVAEAAKGAKDSKVAKEIERLRTNRREKMEEKASLEARVASLDQDPVMAKLAAAHANIGSDVLAETAKLHADDEENLRLWREFLPHCEDEIERIYKRLGVRFDYTLGESFYHSMLGPLVEELIAQGIAKESDGAIAVFLDGHEAPMLIRKQDGAFLYGTTDLATIRYRMENWHPDAILYVVDHRQGLHFTQLFAVAPQLGYDRVELRHVSFGTVLGDDGRPFRTRAGDTIGLEGLLDEAVRRAAEVVAANDDAKPAGPELSPADRARIAETVGIAAIKYADLSQNRTSDYVFSYDKMLAMNGNTATYMQYAYARVRSIFAKGNVDMEALRQAAPPILLDTPAERALGLELLRFGEAIDLALADFRPNQLTSYLFDLANRYATFYESSPVLAAPSESLRNSRLLLCDLTARTLRQGLELLGINVVDKM